MWPNEAYCGSNHLLGGEQAHFSVRKWCHLRSLPQLNVTLQSCKISSVTLNSSIQIIVIGPISANQKKKKRGVLVLIFRAFCSRSLKIFSLSRDWHISIRKFLNKLKKPTLYQNFSRCQRLQFIKKTTTKIIVFFLPNLVSFAAVICILTKRFTKRISTAA